VPAELRRDPVTRRRAMLALGLIAANTVVGLALLAPLALIKDPTLRLMAIVNTVVSLALMALAVLFLRRGSLWLTGNWLCFILFVGLGWAIYNGTGVRAPFAMCLPLLPMLAGIISGRRSGLTWGLLSIGFTTAIYVM